MLITIGIVLPVILFTQSNNVITLVDPGHESGKVVMFACCDHPESCRVASGIQLYSAGERCVLLSTDELWGQLEIFKDYDQFSSQYCVILEEFVPAYGSGSDT
ncbi:MAG: hypothetical protein PVF85_04335 [Anaerolineales bacterium]|jgi:hypothetical protein